MIINNANVNLGTGHNLFHVNAVNRSVGDESQNIGVEKINENKDNATISPTGKAVNFLESLLKQKQNIQERKNELIGGTLEKGGNISDIEAQLDLYDEQLKNIDEQIAEATAKSLEESEKENKNKIDLYEKPKTESEIQSERLHNIMSLSSTMEQAETIETVKGRIDGEANVLKSQIKTDGDRASESKIDRVAELEARSADIMGQVSEKVGEVTEEVNENRN